MTEQSDRLRARAKIAGRQKSLFRQADLQRALRAAQAAGLHVKQFEIRPDGSVSVLTSASTGEIVSTPLEQWKSSRARTS